MYSGKVKSLRCLKTKKYLKLDRPYQKKGYNINAVQSFRKKYCDTCVYESLSQDYWMLADEMCLRRLTSESQYEPEGSISPANEEVDHLSR